MVDSSQQSQSEDEDREDKGSPMYDAVKQQSIEAAEDAAARLRHNAPTPLGIPLERRFVSIESE